METNEKYYCPFAKNECMTYGCGLYSPFYESCSFLLIAEGMKEISFSADDTNLDCALRVSIQKPKGEYFMSNEFFMAMVPPTVTHQEKQVRVAGGKPVLYEPPELKAARQKLVAYLGQHVPDEPYHCGVRLITKWCFPRGKHLDGTYRLSKPDTDNLQKLLKDCMTKVGFWDDDALVASEIVEKFWAEVPGIYVRIDRLP